MPVCGGGAQRIAVATFHSGMVNEVSKRYRNAGNVRSSYRSPYAGKYTDRTPGHAGVLPAESSGA